MYELYSSMNIFSEFLEEIALEKNIKPKNRAFGISKDLEALEGLKIQLRKCCHKYVL